MFDVLPITSENAADCGATCLAMLLDFYGKEWNLEELRRECNTSIIGCRATDILRAGRNHGLDMVAFQMDAAELIRQDRPAIVWWLYRHFVVFAGCDEDGKVVVCNPDRGRYRMSKGQFASFYTGVSLWNGEPHDLPEAGASA